MVLRLHLSEPMTPPRRRALAEQLRRTLEMMGDQDMYIDRTDRIKASEVLWMLAACEAIIEQQELDAGE